MYEARRKLFPKIPKSLSEAKAMIYKCKTDFFLKGEQFCFMESADSIPIFTTASNLLLLNNAQHVFADGTFSYAPKHFLQMYTIHVYINGFYLPIIYVFMETKTHQVYNDAWLNIKQLFFKFHEKPLHIKKIHLDFEKAAHNAVLKVFQNCLISGCRFHLSQAWFRRIQSDKELYKHYMEKTDVYKWLQSFFRLSFISPNEVSIGFVALILDAPVHVAETFTDYIFETFVDDNSSFPPYLWVESPSSDPRTTNWREAFHRDFNS